jgi:hypothetical protein
MKALTAEGTAKACLAAYVALALLGVLSYDTSMLWLVVSGFVLLPVIVWGTRNQRGLVAFFVGFTLVVALRSVGDAAQASPAVLKARQIGHEAELAKLRAELANRSAAGDGQGTATARD